MWGGAVAPAVRHHRACGMLAAPCNGPSLEGIMRIWVILSTTH